jgi:hypothetical protein
MPQCTPTQHNNKGKNKKKRNQIITNVGGDVGKKKKEPSYISGNVI